MKTVTTVVVMTVLVAIIAGAHYLMWWADHQAPNVGKFVVIGEPIVKSSKNLPKELEPHKRVEGQLQLKPNQYVRRFDQVEEGETVYIKLDALMIDPDGYVWVSQNAKVHPNKGYGFWITAHRTADGVHLETPPRYIGIPEAAWVSSGYFVPVLSLKEVPEEPMERD